jgi:hypothetical protein
MGAFAPGSTPEEGITQLEEFSIYKGEINVGTAAKMGAFACSQGVAKHLCTALEAEGGRHKGADSTIFTGANIRTSTDNNCGGDKNSKKDIQTSKSKEKRKIATPKRRGKTKGGTGGVQQTIQRFFRADPSLGSGGVENREKNEFLDVLGREAGRKRFRSGEANKMNNKVAKYEEG